MKKYTLVIAAFLLSLACKAQLSYSFCLTPTASTSTDSVTMVATLLASDGYNYISWADSAGPSVVALPSPVNTWGNNMLEQSVLTVHKLVPGNYIFKATGVSLTGNSGTLVCKVTVLPPPAQRTLVSFTITVAGMKLVVPVAAGLPLYSDGSIQ